MILVIKLVLFTKGLVQQANSNVRIAELIVVIVMKHLNLRIVQMKLSMMMKSAMVLHWLMELRFVMKAISVKAT